MRRGVGGEEEKVVKEHRNVLNPFSSPVFSSFLPHLLLFYSYTLPCVLFPFLAEKFFLAAFSAFLEK